MRSLLVFAFMMSLSGIVFSTASGCSSMSHKSSATTQTSEVDDCPMCPGVQHANADGTCPKCGMKVKG